MCMFVLCDSNLDFVTSVCVWKSLCLCVCLFLWVKFMHFCQFLLKNCEHMWESCHFYLYHYSYFIFVNGSCQLVSFFHLHHHFQLFFILVCRRKCCVCFGVCLMYIRVCGVCYTFLVDIGTSTLLAIELIHPCRYELSYFLSLYTHFSTRTCCHKLRHFYF